MADHNNTDEFNMDESSAFSNYARNAKSVVKTSEAVTESSDAALLNAAETTGKAVEGGSKAAKGLMGAASAGTTAVVSAVGKVATAFGVPKQVVAFFIAIVTLFTSVAVAMPDGSSKYAPPVEKLCGGGPEVNEQMIAKEPVSQEERILRAAKIYRYFHAFDFTDEAAAGIIANIMADSDGNADTYEGDDINLNFELVSMHHDNWDAYTKNLFAVYTSGSTENDGYPRHTVDLLFGGDKSNARSGAIGTNNDKAVDSVYKTNKDLYSNNESLFDKEHKNVVTGRYLPGFGLFQWAGTRANDMLYYANSLHLARDVDDDMNNDYVYEVPFQIAYLLYEDNADVYEWARTSYRTDYNISFMKQFMTYTINEADGSVKDRNEATYTEKLEKTLNDEVVREVKLTHYKPTGDYEPTTMLQKFTTDIKNDDEEIPARNPKNWRIAQANVTKTDDYYLYQYYGVIFDMETDVYRDTPATKPCPEEYSPYGHMDAAHNTDAPNHDIVAKDYTVYVVPVLYTLRVANDAPEAVLKKIEQIMWEELPRNVYEKLKGVSGADIHLKAYVQDINHGENDSEHIKDDEYREKKNFSTKALLDEVKDATKDVSSTDSTDKKTNQNYIKAKFGTTGYWNWICNDYTLHDIKLLDSSALEKAYKKYEAAVARYNALNNQLGAANNLVTLADSVKTSANNVHDRYNYVETVTYPAALEQYEQNKANYKANHGAWAEEVKIACEKWFKAQGYHGYTVGYERDDGVYNNFLNFDYLQSKYDIRDPDECFAEGWDNAQSDAEEHVDIYDMDDIEQRAADAAAHSVVPYNTFVLIYRASAISNWKNNNKDVAKDAERDAYIAIDSLWYTEPSFNEPEPTLEGCLNNDFYYNTYLSDYTTAVDNYNNAVDTYNNGIRNTNHNTHDNFEGSYDPAQNSSVVKIDELSNSGPSDKIGNPYADKYNNIGNAVTERDRVGVDNNGLVGKAKQLITQTRTNYRKEYNTYATKRTEWENERNKYYGKSGQRDDYVPDNRNKYTWSQHLKDPQEQAYWLSLVERGFDTYWYQYTGGVNGTKTVKDTKKGDTITKNCITFHTTKFVDIKDPFDDSRNEGMDFYWVGQNKTNEIERYVKYEHRYNVHWKNDDYSTNKTNGYAELLKRVAGYGYDLTRGEIYTVLREIQPVYAELLQEEFEQWLKDNNKGELKDLEQDKIEKLFSEFAETSTRYKNARDNFNKAYGNLFVHTDEDIEGDINQIVDKYLKDVVMTSMYGDKSVRISYQNGEDIAYDCAVWFYRNWKGKTGVGRSVGDVPEDNPDFKAHTDPARYWYYIIKSRGWAAYADGETSGARPMYNDASRKSVVESYLKGYVSGWLYPAMFYYANKQDDGTMSTGYGTKKDKNGIVTHANGNDSYKISLLQTATDKIYDMYNRKTCGLAELDVSSPAALAVSMAYPYGEENYTINDVIDHYELKKGSKIYDIYPAVRCTETYVGVVNTIIAVDNAKTGTMGSIGLSEMGKQKNVDSNEYSYYVYHVDLDINDTNGKGELLNYSDPGTAVHAVYAGSGASPELPYSFEDQKRYLRFRNDFSMKQAADVLINNSIDLITDLDDSVVKDLSSYMSQEGSNQKGNNAYSRESWYLAGEITADTDSDTDYTYKMNESNKRSYPLYGYYKAVSQNYNKWMNDIKPGDLIMTDSNAYIFVGDEAYDKFSDYMSPIEAHTAVCTAWKSDDPTCQAYDKDKGRYDADPLRASGITVCTYNDFIDRGVYDKSKYNKDNRPEYADVTKVSTGFLSSFVNKRAAQKANTLKLIYEYHKSRGEKVFVYRCMNYDNELSWPRNTLNALDFSSYNNGDKPAIVKYDGMQQYPLYEATGKETLGHIYEISPLPQDDLDGKAKAIAAVIDKQNNKDNADESSDEETGVETVDTSLLKGFVDLEYAAKGYTDYKGVLGYKVSIEAIPVNSSE